ncbi:MAG TPA: antibiotic biosynthesis monooxygenase [Candidatus Dormibacteraeota bacterium]|jgi:hypothetical protein
MILRVAWFEPMAPEVEAEMLNNLRVRFRAALQAQPGYVSAYWGRAENGSWVSTSLWESRETVEEAGKRANEVPLVAGQRAELIPSPTSMEVYEVIEEG